MSDGDPPVPPSPGQRLLRSVFEDGEPDESMEGTDFDLTPVQYGSPASRRGSTGHASIDHSGERNMKTVFGHDLSDVPEFLSSSQELTWLSASQEDAMKRARQERSTIHQRVVTKSSDRIKEYKRYCRNCARRGQKFLSFRQWWAAHKSELIRTGGTPQTSPTQFDQRGYNASSNNRDAHGGFESESFDLNASSSLDSSVNSPATGRAGTASRSGAPHAAASHPPGRTHERTRSTSSIGSLSVATATHSSGVATDGSTPPGIRGQKLLRTIGPSPKRSDQSDRVVIEPELPQAAELAARRAQTHRRERSRSQSAARAAMSSNQMEPSVPDALPSPNLDSEDSSSPIKVIERAKHALEVETQQYEQLQEEVTEEQRHAKLALQQRLAQRRKAHSRSNSRSSPPAEQDVLASHADDGHGGQSAGGRTATDGDGKGSVGAGPPATLHHQLGSNSDGGGSRSSSSSPAHADAANSRAQSFDLSQGMFGGDSRPPTTANSPAHSGHNSRTSADLSAHSRHASEGDSGTLDATDSVTIVSTGTDDEEDASQATTSPQHTYLINSQPPSAASTPQHVVNSAASTPMHVLVPGKSSPLSSLLHSVCFACHDVRFERSSCNKN